MKAIVKIPIDLYRALEWQCGNTRPEYRLLKSGVIDEGRRHVVIRCEPEHALRLCAWANNRANGATRRITVAPEDGMENWLE